MNIDDYIQQRNEVQLVAENISEEAAKKCWVELGVANRHIERVLDGMFRLDQVEHEIVKCLQRVKKIHENN